MGAVKIYSEKQLSRYLSLRNGETRLGEKVQVLKASEKLSENDAQFVIFGVPEDIGVRANHGKPGTSNAWEAFLKAFLNIQHNRFFDSGKVLVLGEIESSEEMRKASQIDPSDPNYHAKLGDITEKVDEKVSEVVKKIISADKIPVIIGGGHNNAYGNLKGAAEAFQKKVNVLNIDAHTDLRTTDHRHSGNGFSYARKNGFLNRYSIFGLHQNYTPDYIFEEMDSSEGIHYSLFENLQKADLSFHFQEDLDFVKVEKFGLELDCDAIAGFPSSAVSPTGFSLNETREFVRNAAREKNCCYLHVCEAIATDDYPTGKALSFLVTDFLKAKQ
ncbi:formiminoglutamase [Salinimicrobium catena]|uniref:Formiminoglutamase n=1 Tax=Salinimicrobium catena TaxID=390640 RepID=A0A1H5L6Z9_9FLAO|nr:formimidoylglutamase [Salinimicrobium catena]SDL06366.1 formiminoglutamase [Salinimicrobium catena]SEE72724.1 formiminoglutamase [Salinimicrobium catena]